MGRRWGWTLGIALGLILVIVLVLWQPWRATEPHPRPHVVLVTVDALRADHMDTYGSTLGLTPHIDSLAARATVFERAVTPVPLSAASLASIMTGRLPIQHRLRTDRRGTLRKLEQTLPERLQATGYRTAAFLGSRYPFSANIPQGCDTVLAPAGPERPAEEVVRAAMGWLTGGPQAPSQRGAGEIETDEPVPAREDTGAWSNSNSKAPRFAWLHIAEPSGPWRAPFPWSLQHLDHPYRGEVAAVDHAVGLLMSELEAHGLAENTHVILLGTTGEALGEQGEIEHGVLLEQSTLQVPLIWSLPIWEEGAGPRRVAGLMATTDLLPTLLSILEIPLEPMGAGRAQTQTVGVSAAGAGETGAAATGAQAPGSPGASVSATGGGDTGSGNAGYGDAVTDSRLEGTAQKQVFGGTEPTSRTHLMLETFLPRDLYGWAPLLGVWSDPWLFVSGPNYYLYNIENAPHRAQPTSADLEVIAAQMFQTLGNEIERTSPLPQDREQWPEWARGQSDPYRRVSMSSDLIEASRDLQYGDPYSAQRHAERLTARFPDHPRVQALRAYSHLGRGEHLAAERNFREILDRFSVACEARLGLAECLLAQGNPRTAESALAQMRPDSLGSCLWLLAPDPDLDFRHWRLRGYAAARQGRCAEATGHFMRAAETAQLPSQRRQASELYEAARVLADALRRIDRIHPRERQTVLHAALALEWPAGARRILGLQDKEAGSADRDPAPAPRPREDDDVALDLLESYEALQTGRLDHTVRLMKQAITTRTAQASNVTRVARALEERGRRRQALELLEFALPRLDQSDDIYFALAVLQAGERSTGESAANLKNAFREGFDDWDRLLSRRLRRLVTRDDLQGYWQQPRL